MSRVMEVDGAEEKNKTESAPTDPRELVSSDDEIDYSIEPEFYGPNIDDKDELWVHKQRKGQTSDAVLSCPACFTTLCLDCQRHEKYVTQYRAMFVINCKVITDQILRETKPKRAPRRSKDCKHSVASNEATQSDEIFRPVCCSVCLTEVGVYDKDEVYHFFDVIPSNA
ncbi:E2F-associated phosphoprotein [Canna indica]|uniref:E2F-associated phosphoprotein n=1 Tax=Canna indica TaxID=4628 RepID=A0AAQ3KJ01_9LILI|nr:E2F-associated phosphoprotein [Canna indica]